MEGETGRGMLLYIKNGINYSLLDLKDFCAVEEAQIISIKEEEGKEILFASVYRSPNSEAINDDNFNTLLAKLTNSRYANVIICGDMNYPLVNWDLLTNNGNSADKSYRFIETVKDCYLTQHVDRPTRGRG
jgi:hypothetical protein